MSWTLDLKVPIPDKRRVQMEKKKKKRLVTVFCYFFINLCRILDKVEAFAFDYFHVTVLHMTKFVIRFWFLNFQFRL